MIYKGPETNVDRGSKFADQYGFLTNNMLDILKLHGNMLVSVTRYNAILNKIYKKKYNQTIDIIKTKDIADREIALIGKCHKELLAELTRLTGFKSFSIRRVEPYTKDQATCLIFERAIESDGDTNVC